jgi:hypothetical protein
LTTDERPAAFRKRGGPAAASGGSAANLLRRLKKPAALSPLPVDRSPEKARLPPAFLRRPPGAAVGSPLALTGGVPWVWYLEGVLRLLADENFNDRILRATSLRFREIPKSLLVILDRSLPDHLLPVG